MKTTKPIKPEDEARTEILFHHRTNLKAYSALYSKVERITGSGYFTK